MSQNTDNIKIISIKHNCVVVHIPGRKFPGIVLQADTLKSARDELLDAMEALVAGNSEMSQISMREVVSGLNELLRGYVSAVEEAGLALPFEGKI